MTVGFNRNNPMLQKLQSLGLDPEKLLGHLAAVQHHGGALRSMLDKFSQSANLPGSGLQQSLSSGAIPQSSLAAAPNAAQCPCSSQYAASQDIDFGAMPGAAPNSTAALANRQNGRQIESLIRQNPEARQALEARLGGRILPDAMNDGVMRIQRSPFGTANRGAPNAANTAMHNLGGISRGAVGAGSTSPFGPGAYQNMMVGALQNTLGHGPANFAPTNQSTGRTPQRRLFSVNPFEQRPPIPGAFPGAAGGFPGGGLAGIGGGGGFGGGAPMAAAAPAAGGVHSFAGGGGGAPAAFAGGGAPAAFAGGGAPAAFAGGAGAPAALGGGGAFNTAGMTIEDQVVMLLMQITKGFDKQIQDQANAVNKMQQQQGGKGGGKGGKGAGGDKSIDVETMKLKRLIDKRGQMFDMLRQVIDKYNETAKNMIQAVGR